MQNASASNVIGYADDISLSLPIVFSTLKEDLSNALADAQSALNSAISIIPAAVKNSYGTVITGAQAVYNDLNSTEAQLNSALSTLTGATSVFKARNVLGTTCQTTQIFSDAQVETGKQYEYPLGSKGNSASKN